MYFNIAFALLGNSIPRTGKRHNNGAKTQSNKENSSLKKKGLSANNGSNATRLSNNCCLEASTSTPILMFATKQYQSNSMRCIILRVSALATGYTGNKGGCGKRSSKYSIIIKVTVFTYFI